MFTLLYRVKWLLTLFGLFHWLFFPLQLMLAKEFSWTSFTCYALPLIYWVEVKHSGIKLPLEGTSKGLSARLNHLMYGSKLKIDCLILVQISIGFAIGFFTLDALWWFRLITVFLGGALPVYYLLTIRAFRRGGEGGGKFTSGGKSE